MNTRLYGTVVLVFLLFFGLLGCDSGSEPTVGPGTEKPGEIGEFTITSSAFNNNERLGDKYCNFSSNTSLPFKWENPPKDVESFALIIHDPQGENWIHWAVVNIPKDCTSIVEGASGTSKMPAGSIELLNEFSTIGDEGTGYGGPEPPPGSGTHRYTVELYALNVPTITGVSSSVFKDYSAINSLLAGKIIERVEMVGTYSR